MQEIKRKKGTTFRAKIYVNGKAITKCFDRKSDAKEWKQNQKRLLQKQAASGIKINPCKNANDFFDLWFDRKKTSQLEERSLVSYKSALNAHIMPFFGHKKLDQIRRNDGELFKTYLSKTGLSNGRAGLILKVLKMIFSDAFKWEYLLLNPFQNLDNVKKDIRIKNFWSISEVDKFLSTHVHHADYELYVVALNTGMRLAELLGLCWDCVDFETNKIIIKRQMQSKGLKEYTKTKQNRIIQMNETAKLALLRLKAQKRHDTFVFTSREGSTYDPSHYCNRIFNPALKASGVKKIRFHDLRTTFGCMWCMRGNDIFALSKILGHSSVKITEDHYADFHPNSTKTMNGFEIKVSGAFLAHENVVSFENPTIQVS
jgi:integrase